VRVVAHVKPTLAQVVLDTTDARRAAEFWRQLVGLIYRPGHEPPADGADDPAGRDWLNLTLPDRTPVLAFQQVTELAQATWPEHRVPQQLHLDLTVRDVEELDAVHDHVLALGGALRLDRSDDEEEPLRVYADPDGHPFCVFVVGDEVARVLALTTRTGEDRR
jgi:catechol 2,3-dioxygenase-like lactoylglutathione lyase family enzyme